MLLGSDLHWCSGRLGRQARLGVAANGRLRFLPVRPAQSAVSMLDTETTVKGRRSCSLFYRRGRRVLSDVSISVPAGARWQCQCPSLVLVPSAPMLDCLLGNWMMSSNSILLEKVEGGG